MYLDDPRMEGIRDGGFGSDMLTDPSGLDGGIFGRKESLRGGHATGTSTGTVVHNSTQQYTILLLYIIHHTCTENT